MFRAKTRRRVFMLTQWLLLAAIIVCTAVVQMSGPNDWDLTTSQKTPFIVALALAALLSPGIKLYKEYRPPADEKMSEPLQEMLGPFCVDVARLTQTDLAQVGVHVFRVRNWAWWKCLKRCKRVRLHAHPGTVDIKWTAGKGALGICWEKGRWAVHNLRTEVEPGGEPVTPQIFDGWSDDRRKRLSYEEYSVLVSDFAEYAAWPIKNADADVVGCLVIDIPLHGDAPNPRPLGLPPGNASLLDVEDLKQKAAAVAVYVGQQFERKAV